MLQERLIKNVKIKIGDYQCGFVQGESRVDAIYLAKQIMEKAYEFKVDLEIMFIDFQRAIISLKKNKLINTLMEIKVDIKLILLIRMTVKSTTIKIRTGAGEINSITINESVK